MVEEKAQIIGLKADSCLATFSLLPKSLDYQERQLLLIQNKKVGTTCTHMHSRRLNA